MHISVNIIAFFSLSVYILYILFLNIKNQIVTVHSVHSNVAKIHSRLPAAMEFWLVCACMSRDFGIFMPKHLAGQWCVNSNTRLPLTVHALLSCEYPLDFPFAVSYGYMTI